MGKIAWVTGATGLVGQQLMLQLSADERYSKIIAFVRKQSSQDWTQHKKVHQILIDFDQLPSPQLQQTLEPANELYIALGTTKKQTPDKKQFYTIDVEYPVRFAKFGQRCGASFCGVVSAHGANAGSPVYYLKMKGGMEGQLIDLSFDQLAIARPGLLKGEREEFRLLEKVTEYVTNVMPGNYKSIHVRDVAAALIRAAQDQRESMTVLSSKSMQKSYRA